MSWRVRGQAWRNSAVSVMRRYSGFAKRRLDGEYGERSTGCVGLGACTGFTSSTPASSSELDLLAIVARSAKSPIPHESFDRAA